MTKELLGPIQRSSCISNDLAKAATTLVHQTGDGPHKNSSMTVRLDSYGRPRRHEHRQSPPNLGRMGLYERSKWQKAERERKMNVLRAQLMEECTFTPKTSRSSASVSTRTPSTGEESVFERLYRNSGSISSGSKVTPIASNKTRGRTPSSISPTERSTMSRSSSVMSNRIQSLYEEGVWKLRNRPANDAVERERRDRRREEKELAHCTFRPLSANNIATSAALRRSNLVMEPTNAKRKQSKRRVERLSPSDVQGTKKSSFPKEIVVTQPFRISPKNDQRWRTPKRKQLGADPDESPDFVVVSPLRDQFYNALYPETASQAMSRTQQTEYGSI